MAIEWVLIRRECAEKMMRNFLGLANLVALNGKIFNSHGF
jgi:hypothetical protein